jgi:hypothetical protein
MSDFDLDRLGDVWRQQPDPAELERLKKSAATVARRARRAQVVDIAAALLVSGLVIFLVAANPKPGTILMGAAAILVLLAGNIRLRRVRQIELRNLTGSTEEMLDQSINRAETTARYQRFVAMNIAPAAVIGALVAWASQGRQVVPALQSGSPLRILWVALGVAVLAGGIVYALRAMKRAKLELERLRAMREAYRREHDSTGA